MPTSVQRFVLCGLHLHLYMMHCSSSALSSNKSNPKPFPGVSSCERSIREGSLIHSCFPDGLFCAAHCAPGAASDSFSVNGICDFELWWRTDLLCDSGTHTYLHTHLHTHFHNFRLQSLTPFTPGSSYVEAKYLSLECCRKGGGGTKLNTCGIIVFILYFMDKVVGVFQNTCTTKGKCLLCWKTRVRHGNMEISLFDWY